MIYIGCPAYDAKLHHTTVGGLFNVAYALGKERAAVCLDVIPKDPSIGHARDMMAKRFLSIPDATDMIMVDADVGFGVAEFDALMKVDADIVCGVYPYKQDKERYPVAAQQPPEKRGRLVTLVFGPTGFMRVRRKVLETLKTKVECYQDESDGGVLHEFFRYGRDGFVLRGEDAYFCRLATTHGFKVLGLEGLALKHTGEKTWEGCWRVDSAGADIKIVKAA